MLQRVAEETVVLWHVEADLVCCSVLQCVAGCCSVLMKKMLRHSDEVPLVLQCVAVCCSVLQEKILRHVDEVRHTCVTTRMCQKRPIQIKRDLYTPKET